MKHGMYPRLCGHVNNVGKNHKRKRTYRQRLLLIQPSRNSGLSLFTAQDPEFRIREDGSSLLPRLLAEMASRTGLGPPCWTAPQPSSLCPVPAASHPVWPSFLRKQNLQGLLKPREAPPCPSMDYCGRHSPNPDKGERPPAPTPAMSKAVKSHCDGAFRMGGQSCDDCNLSCFNTAMKSLCLPL